MTTFDLGRSDLDNPGLIEFKDRWGTRRADLHYLRYPMLGRRKAAAAPWMRLARQLVTLVPDPLVVTAGKRLYRHFS
jgi:hypothetical protein